MQVEDDPNESGRNYDSPSNIAIKDNPNIFAFESPLHNFQICENSDINVFYLFYVEEYITVYTTETNLLREFVRHF